MISVLSCILEMYLDCICLRTFHRFNRLFITVLHNKLCKYHLLVFTVHAQSESSDYH